MILTRIFDRVMDLKGEFQVTQFTIGTQKTDPSYARLIIKGNSAQHLEKMLQEIYREGAVPVQIESVKLKPAPADMVMPNDFYSTTNHHTYIHLDGSWVKIQDQVMDKCIVVDPTSKTARCEAIRNIRKGELIVVGEVGIKVEPPERPREGLDVFQFMSSATSTEKPTTTLIKRIAADILETKKKGGKIIVVGGPAIVHTGGADAFAKLIRLGYVDALLAGNALAVHDIEHALFGTSLGVSVANGQSAHRGHRNHMADINQIFKAGSLKAMVKKKTLTRGIMFECIMNDVPYVLAASIRDDGPIPDAIIDMVEAQRRYREILKGAEVVLMLSTMLHSIAVGNMLPSNVKTIAIDINPSAVTKLLDRGSGQALGVVSDVGTFLPLLLSYLEKQAR
ncbi:MAG: TIGR00300 family protein [Thaumarchaeota archaeon]|nr:TIGR00300 family protein [Nitrososphaerota archaeon]